MLFAGCSIAGQEKVGGNNRCLKLEVASQPVQKVHGNNFQRHEVIPDIEIDGWRASPEQKLAFDKHGDLRFRTILPQSEYLWQRRGLKRCILENFPERLKSEQYIARRCPIIVIAVNESNAYVTGPCL